ncbi:MAG: hypothetical protein ACRCTQ_01560 [Brevinemataceae bacterium]
MIKWLCFFNKDIVEKILAIDFLREMAEGTLPEEVFHYYIEQDVLYLDHYAECCNMLSQRIEKKNISDYFVKLSSLCSDEQDRIHNNIPYKPTNLKMPGYVEYCKFLTEQSLTARIAVAWSSMIVCPWIYIYAARYYLESGLKSNRYRFWFEENASNAVVQEFQVHQRLFEEFCRYRFWDYKQIITGFRKALVLEYNFWNDAYLLKSTENEKNRK